MNRFLKYCDEALGLGLFMFSAGFFDMLIDDPDLYIRQHLHSALVRRFLIGLTMGLTALFIFTSRFGKDSGAYINPSVTLVRFWLHDISVTDGLFYILFQLAGGSLGMYIVYILFPTQIAHPAVNYIVTQPPANGVRTAFVLEFVISFVLISVVLFTEKSRTLMPFTPYLVASLIVLYITFEAPYSGMSMNPARTFASAIVAGQWHVFWLYCIAPSLGMLSGGALYRIIYSKSKQ